MKKLKMILAIASLLIAATPARAASARRKCKQRAKQPIYTITINVVDRTTKAINYQHRNGATTIDFRGTPLMPAARGEAKVESKQGYMEVEVEFDNLQSATRFGPEFLTYVMWAITPEGRATNMGEVILNGTKSKLNVTTELQAFGTGCHCRTVFRRVATKRRRRDGKLRQKRHGRQSRRDRCEIRALATRPVHRQRPAGRPEADPIG